MLSDRELIAMYVLLACCAYINIDRLAIRILDCRVISFDEDSLDELRFSAIDVSKIALIARDRMGLGESGKRYEKKEKA